VSNNLVFRYNVEHTQDGLVGEEGTFSICTFWVNYLSLRFTANYALLEFAACCGAVMLIVTFLLFAVSHLCAP
jgi:GH15 family glucan-1,4-alpha-glucosidase